MSTATTVAFALGGVCAAGFLVYLLMPSSTAAAATNPSVGGPATATNPSGLPPYTVTLDQNYLNAIATAHSWPAVPTNGVINDPTFTATLKQFQVWFNATYTPASAHISTALNTNGILDAATSGALIYVYGLITPKTTPTQ